MSTFQFNLTHKCNLNCPFCYSYHNKDIMSNEIIEKGTEFVINKIHTNDIDIPQVISFSGGEVFLGNYKAIPNIINKIKNECSNWNLHFILQSNLTTELIVNNEDIINVINSVDEVGTSGDPDHFKIQEHYYTWLKNIKYIQSLKKQMDCVIVVTKNLLNKYPTLNLLIDNFIKLGFKHIELTRLCEPIESRDLSNSKPLNSVVRKWFEDGYEYYKECQKVTDFEIQVLKCMEDAYNGIFYYDHARNCQEDWFTILPNGKIGTCALSVADTFYDLNTKVLEIDNHIKVCQKEKILREDCKRCKYIDICKGDCYRSIWDESGCSMPYKIFDMIKERNK